MIKINREQVKKAELELIRLTKSLTDDPEINGGIMQDIENAALRMARFYSIEGNRRAQIIWGMETYVPDFPFAFPDEIEEEEDEEELYEPPRYPEVDDEDDDLWEDEDYYSKGDFY